MNNEDDLIYNRYDEYKEDIRFFIIKRDYNKFYIYYSYKIIEIQ